MVPSSPNEHEFLTPEEWQSVNALLKLNRTVQVDLDAALRAEHGLAVTEFDVLITLFNAPDRRLGMSALAEQVMLSPAGISHLVTRLERDGLLRREIDAIDRRKGHAVLTDAGDDMLRTARRTHNAVLRRGFLGATRKTERQALQRIWRRLTGASVTRPG